MKRLRHIPTGDVYGWNYEMAKQPDMEEFDDEDPNAEFEKVQKTPSVNGQPPVTVVGDDPQEVMDRSIQAAAQDGLTSVVSQPEPTDEGLDDGDGVLPTDIARDEHGDEVHLPDGRTATYADLYRTDDSGNFVLTDEGELIPLPEPEPEPETKKRKK